MEGFEWKRSGPNDDRGFISGKFQATVLLTRFRISQNQAQIIMLLELKELEKMWKVSPNTKPRLTCFMKMFHARILEFKSTSRMRTDQDYSQLW